MSDKQVYGSRMPLFANKKKDPPTKTLFWLSQNVPRREDYTKKIKANGGEVVLLENVEDVVRIVHPWYNYSPHDGLSYKYIDDSIRSGRIPEGEALNEYKVKPSAPRPMGATHIPRKGTRTDFNLADDRILYDWVQEFEKTQDALSGNKIYQDLAAKFPHHPWQSWRGRYLRKLRGKPRPGGGTTRPDLLGVGPEPRNHLQQLPLTAAQSRASIAFASHTPSSAETSAKRKHKVSPLGPSHSADASASSPTKRMKPSSRRISSPVEERSSSDQLNSHPTIHPTPFSPHMQSIHESAQEFSGNFQEHIDPNFLELPFLPSSPEPDDGEESEEDPPDVDSWINMQLARGIADEETVIAVLCSASMDQGLADKVLENWGPGSTIPENMPGIWTAEDDRSLEAGDGREVQRVITKHGEELLNTRWEYLRMARERGLL